MNQLIQTALNDVTPTVTESSANSMKIAMQNEWNRAKLLFSKDAWDRAKTSLTGTNKHSVVMRWALFGLLILGVSFSTFLRAPAAEAAQVRIKDISYIDGVRANQLIGYGLVVGLDGTGDTQRVVFTTQSLSAMLLRAGVRVDPSQLILRNVAAVMVTANLPPFSSSGARIDVSVSSIGNARSIAGGTLLLTPLNGADGETYALAQGPVQVGNDASRSRVSSGGGGKHYNVGRVPTGGIVERGVPIKLASDNRLVLRLQNADFTTAQRMTQALNQAAGNLGVAPNFASTRDSSTVILNVAGQANNLANLIAQMETISLIPDAVAKVILNGNTGTVVMGENVRISTVAVAHGGLELRVRSRQVQPNPGQQFDANGNPIAAAPVTPAAGTTRAADKLTMVDEGATLNDVVQSLNALGVKPRELVAILQAISAAGALHAKLEVL
jgi:flagellar P-ring protein precursor FlgI